MNVRYGTRAVPNWAYSFISTSLRPRADVYPVANKEITYERRAFYSGEDDRDWSS